MAGLGCTIYDEVSLLDVQPQRWLIFYIGCDKLYTRQTLFGAAKARVQIIIDDNLMIIFQAQSQILTHETRSAKDQNVHRQVLTVSLMPSIKLT